ncbi:MAG: hypothetical protein Q9217_001975 [Psora testacea]
MANPLPRLQSGLKPPTREPWSLALHNATKRLDEQDCAQIFLVRGVEDLVRALAQIQSQKQGKPMPRLISRIEPFIAVMKSFSEIISVFVSSDPAIAALIWGSIKVLIELTSRSVETLEKLIDVLNDIGAHLPRFELYAQLFPGQERLETALDEHRHQEILSLVNTKDRSDSMHLKELPCHFIRYSEPSSFKGRTNVLREVFEHLNPVNGNAPPKRFVLTGPGGVGKTQIALRYAYDHLETYPAIFWISAETEARLLQDFQGIAVILSLGQSTESIRPERARDLTLQWLRKTDIPWLLIFDNVEDFGLLQPYWPKTSKGSLLLTSRYPILAKSINACARLVEPFDQVEGARLLLSLTTNDERDFDHAREISERLGGLALGLAHVAGFIRETNCDIQEFHKIYYKRCDQIEVNSVETYQAVFQYERSLSTAWDLSLATLGPESRLLLDLIFFYDPDAIPESLFQNGAELSKQVDLKFLKSRSKYLTTISTLNQRSLLQRNTTSRFISIHRLVQLEACRSWSRDTHQNRYELAASLLANAFPPHHSGQPMNESWTDCATLVPHVFTIAHHFETDDFLRPSTDFVDLLTRCGWYLYERGLHSKSMSILELAERICLQNYQDSLLLADVYTGLACNCKNLNRLVAGEKYALRTIQIRVRELPEGHIKIANGWSDYGLIINCLDKMEEAVYAHSQAITIKKANKDCPPALLAQSYASLGRVLTRLGQLEEAGSLLEEANRINEKRNYIYLYHLGNVRLAEGNLNDSMNLHVQALRVRKEILGQDAHYTGLSFHKVGVLRQMQAAPTEAIALLKEALIIFDAIPELEADLARTSYKLGELLSQCGDEEAASQHKDKARTIRSKLTGSAWLQDETYDDYDSLTAFDNR